MNEKWIANEDAYEGMVRRHEPLWKLIEKFIQDNDISSIVDVGGGMGYASRYCKKYVVFDRNPKMVELLTNKGITAYLDDFMHADVRPVIDYDLVLMLALIEHTGNLQAFIEKALEIKSKFIIISFFKGLVAKDKLLNVGGNCYLQLYSKKTIDYIMTNIGIVNYDIIKVPTDSIIIIRL